MSSSLLEEIDRIVDSSEDADEVLRATVDVLAAEPGIAWAGISFRESGELTLGPSAGVPDEGRRRREPILYQDAPVGELWVDGDVGDDVLSRVAALLSAHVLIGWDTGGDAWEP